MIPRLQLVDERLLAPAQTAVALKLVNEMDLLRLKVIARLHARGLPPDVGWDDLIQEAFTRVLVGSRKPPKNVPMVAFLAGVMRSLRSEHWQRAQRGRDVRSLAEPADQSPDPQRQLIAQQELLAIERLFADDPTALRIIEGLSKGLAAEQIRSTAKIAKVDYNSARRRMRRRLIREGLTCGEP